MDKRCSGNRKTGYSSSSGYDYESSCNAYSHGFFYTSPAYDDSIPTVDRQTKESSHPPVRHRVKPGKELVTTDRPDSIAPVRPPRPRATENLTRTKGIHPISSSKLYSHILNPGTLLYATYFYTTYSIQRILGINTLTPGKIQSEREEASDS